MRVINFYLFALLVLTVGLYSCTEDDFTYQGPLQVEYSGDAAFYTFGNGLFSHTIKKTGKDSLKVSLIGVQQQVDLKLDYEIVPETYYLPSTALFQLEKPVSTPEKPIVFTPYQTTAVTGVDFDLTEMGKTTIPAKSSFGYIRYNVLALPATPKVFFLVLKPTQDVKVAKNYRILRVTISK